MTVQDKIKQIIDDQKAKGLEKYGTTVEDANLNTLDWIRHAQEELVDCLVYLEMLKCKIKTFDCDC